MLVERAVEQRGPLPELGIGAGAGGGLGEDRRGGFLLARFERVMGALGGGHRPAAALVSVSISALTAARSMGLRPGCQTSKMKTTRRLALGFAASCSSVSSN